MNTLVEILKDNTFTVADVQALETKLFFDKERKRPYRVRFAVLLFLSAIIATYGLIGDSDATVIGAMIIAPLMTPILATAAALVMGQMPRAGRALTLVSAGVALVVGTAWLIGIRYTGFIAFADNTQIVGRVSPTINDLVVALAAGAAGAFAMSREDIADSMPGVAISISLVPPLCVVGLALSHGRWEAATGAMLLFVTNLLSILLAGGAVFALLGLSRVATSRLVGHARRNAFLFVTLGIVLVSVPLATASAAAANTALAQYRTSQAAKAWAEGTAYEVRSVRATPGGVTLLVAGHGPLPDTDELIGAVRSSVGQSMRLELEIVPFEQRAYEIVAESVRP